MQEEFIVFTRDLLTRIWGSLQLVFGLVVEYLARVPIDIVVLVGILSLILLVRVPILRSIALIPYLIVRPFLRMFGLFSHTELWSVVYDSKTKYPLDPAYVSIRDPLGVEVASAVTDLEGRFGVVLPRGTYTISVQKTNYSFPSKFLQGKHSDGYHNQLYFGESITIVDDERVLAFHIPMDPEGEDWNQTEKKRMGLFGIFRRKKIVMEGALFFAVVGSLLALAHFIQDSTKTTQLLVLSYGILLLIFSAASLFRTDVLHHSVILERETGAPVPFARIKIFTKEKGFQVAKRITTLHGQFVCLLSPGTYYAVIEKRLADGSYQEVLTSPSFAVKDGYIHKKFIV